MKYLFLLLFFGGSAGADDWLCTSQASTRRGASFYACGVATAKEEDTARIRALENAQAEFTSLCRVSDDCAGKSVQVHPARTECDKTATGFRCYRLVIYSLPQPANTDLVDQFGPPDHILTLGPGEYSFAYRGDMCVYRNDICWVDTKDGQITGSSNLKPTYIHALK